MEAFGLFGFVLAGLFYRIDALEKKLKKASILGKGFNSKDEAGK
ncbi:hypothetical protein [Pseudoalteromonas aurantia]|nr:hypothetical protein [Pseudoalteromonas aurantia]